MIIISLSGGLGNQMFEYAFGLSSAIRNKTVLKLDTSIYTKRNNNRDYKLNDFMITSEIAKDTDFKAIGIPNKNSASALASFHQKIFRMINSRKPLSQKKMYFEEDFTYSPRAASIQDNIILTGNWQSEKYFKNVESVIRQEFTLKNWGLLGSTFKKQIQNEQIGTAIALHVRRGDYVTDYKTNHKHGVLPIEYYKKAFELIANKISNPIFYIFSDDIDWCKKNLTFVKPVVFVSDPELSFAEEISLMSFCKHNIIANSSFSWWGAWLNPRPDKIVIAPQKWFQTTTDTKDLIPDSWIQI